LRDGNSQLLFTLNVKIVPKDDGFVMSCPRFSTRASHAELGSPSVFPIAIPPFLCTRNINIYNNLCAKVVAKDACFVITLDHFSNRTFEKFKS
jgi:hypothetical protein